MKILVKVIFIIVIAIQTIAQAKADHLSSIEIRELPDSIKTNDWIFHWESYKDKKKFFHQKIEIKKSTKTILAKITLKPHPQKQFLLLSAKLINEAEIFIKVGSSIKFIGSGGNLLGNKNQNLFTSTPVIELKDLGNETVIYLKATSPRFIHLNIALKSEQQFLSESELGKFLIYSFIGAIFLISITQMILYLAFKNVTSLYYMTFSWFFALVILLHTGVVSYFITGPTPTFYTYFGNWLFSGPMHLSIFMFTWKMLDTDKKYNPLLYLNYIFCIALLVISLLTFHNIEFGTKLFDAKITIQVSLFISLIIVNALGFKKKRKFSMFIALSWVPTFTYGLMVLLSFIASYYIFTPSLVIIPVIFEMAINCFLDYFRMQELYRHSVESQARQRQNKVLMNAMKTISHDLTNHFFIAENNLELIKKRTNELDPQIILRLDKSKHSIGQCKILLKRVRDWIQAGNGKINVQNESILIIPLLKDSIEIFEDKLKSKNITLIKNWDKDLEHVRIFGDSTAIHNQVFNNAISNAIKFSFRNSQITLSVSQQDKIVTVAIKDSGTGIECESLEKFKASGFIDSQMGTNGETGTGFGMELMKSYMEAFNGEIFIKSNTCKINHGTEVVLEFKSVDKQTDYSQIDLDLKGLIPKVGNF